MSGTFIFAPNNQVPVTLPRQGTSVMSLNGWQFTAKPTTPLQRKYRVRLYGLRWYLDSNGLYDLSTNTTLNAGLLENFYEAHETWDPFTWVHPHRGSLLVRFASELSVPEATPNSGGLIGDGVEVNFIEHNPGY